ncbi:hypothetical protein BDV93DRAFT_607207 [Ceratobasidium sp. AG-I]|nr:hypothetical protein BDV93DRAFT_607207 [Ceratobasidium sp. AG-I]
MSTTQPLADHVLPPVEGASHSSNSIEINASPEIAGQPTFDDRVEEIQRWLDERPEELLCLEGISLEQRDQLMDEFYRRGRRPRCDWYSASKTGYMRIAHHIIHELPGSWLGEQKPLLEDTLVSVARCDTPTLYFSGPANVDLADGSVLQPDQQVFLGLDFNQDHELFYSPRVVLESAFSQPLSKVMEKAWHYLHRSNGNIHAVIICNFTRSSLLDPAFRADISVWVREETGQIDDDFPLEIRHGITHTPFDKPRTEEANIGEIKSSEGSSSSEAATSVSDKATQVDQCSEAQFYCLGGETKRIWKRSERPVIVCNEAKGAQKKQEAEAGRGDNEEREELPGLPLEIYDFLRVCPEHLDAMLHGNGRNHLHPGTHPGGYRFPVMRQDVALLGGVP